MSSCPNFTPSLPDPTSRRVARTPTLPDWCVRRLEARKRRRCGWLGHKERYVKLLGCPLHCLLSPTARSELLPEHRRRQEGGGREFVDDNGGSCRRSKL